MTRTQARDLIDTDTVYPRVCGGTKVRLVAVEKFNGLSPRVRGNRVGSAFVAGRTGSIPACAGEPPRARLPGAPTRVYPRVCGGILTTAFSSSVHTGLSPRVRGNPCMVAQVTMTKRSIPACAGEPTWTTLRRLCCRVYPRVCGGTQKFVLLSTLRTGLSPRVRGNLPAPAKSIPTLRSIPACAGEPIDAVLVPIEEEVYPRVCGGTERRANA